MWHRYCCVKSSALSGHSWEGLAVEFASKCRQSCTWQQCHIPEVSSLPDDDIHELPTPRYFRWVQKSYWSHELQITSKATWYEKNEVRTRVVAELHKHGQLPYLSTSLNLERPLHLSRRRGIVGVVFTACSAVRDGTVVCVDLSSFKICVSTVCSLFTFLWRRILDVAEEASTVLVLAGRFGNKHVVLL